MTLRFRLDQGTSLSLSAPLEWAAIPSFAVLTGPNGTGKTQLLKLIERAAHGTRWTADDGVIVSLDGVSCDYFEVAFLTAKWDLPKAMPTTFQQVEQHTRSFADSLFKRDSGRAYDSLRQELSDLLTSSKSADDLASAMPTRALLWQFRSPGAVAHQLGLLFKLHHIEYRDLLADGLSPADIRAKNGPPSWEVVNRLLAASSLPYTIRTPERLKSRDPYTFQLLSNDTGAAVSPDQLSSGESVLFSLVLTLFASQEYRLQPKLLLLDEPDAHLHTSQIRGFIKTVFDILVGEYGCHVIMTTHRPDTIALVPLPNLFEMRRTSTPRVVPVTSHSALLGQMTSHIIDVMPATRCIFVEDEADVTFYETIRDALTRERKLADNPTLAFRSSSTGRGQTKTPGGKDAVRRAVEKFRADGLRMVRGILDEDNGANSPPPEGVFVIARHSIENYIYDPLVAFCCMIDNRCAPTIVDVEPLSPGDERRLLSMSDSQLQSVVDAVAILLEARLPPSINATPAPRKVMLSSGQQLMIPAWVVSTRGHDLARVAVQVDSCLTRRNLEHALVRSRLAYDDLRHLFFELQCG